MDKPAKTLSQLEEEPATAFFGLTFSEVQGVLRNSLFTAGCLTLCLSLFVRWEVAAIIAILAAIVFGWVLVKRTSANRAGKPLFYHKHIRTYRSRLFIRPAALYQRERNNHP